MLNDESDDFIDSSGEDNEDEKSTEAPKKDIDQFMPDNDPVEEIAPFSEAAEEVVTRKTFDDYG